MVKYPISWRVLACASLVLAAGLGFSGCAGRPAQRTASQYEQDLRLAKRVQTALEESTVYKFPDVRVNVYDSTVQLSGFVATKAQRKYAGDVASRVSGVARVENDLIIRPVPW